MIAVHEARYDDVRDVMDKMSEISLKEMAACGVNNAWLGLKRAKMCKDKGFLKVMRDGEEPLFIFGAAELWSGTYRTWFIGTEKYFDPKNRKAQLATVRTMEQIAKRSPRHVFEASTASTHENVLRWFGMLGFDYVDRKDGRITFRYVGRKLANSGKYAKLLS